MTLMSVLTKKVLRAAPSIAHTIAPCETSTKAIMMTAMATPATTGRAITITIPAIAAMDGATGGKEKSEVWFWRERCETRCLLLWRYVPLPGPAQVQLMRQNFRIVCRGEASAFRETVSIVNIVNAW